MKTAPVIIVQLIHIEGPLKGQIVELSDSIIKIGRHPTCQLKYPADLAIISREHATITRDGNRFKLTDHSSNGTIVNGKKITEIFLKDGDVITVSEGGPKVSFLTEITESSLPAQKIIAPAPVVKQPEPIPQPRPIPVASRPKPIPQPQPVPAVSPTPEPVPQPQPAQVVLEPKPSLAQKVPLVIQYGPTLRSFDKLPLQIGKHPSSGYILVHPSILDVHAEIYFSKAQYYIKDLTGRQVITLNSIPVDQGAVLQKNDLLALSPTGPFFRYLGDGRLSEEEIELEGQGRDTQDSVINRSSNSNNNGSVKKPLSFFQKILKKM